MRCLLLLMSALLAFAAPAPGHAQGESFIEGHVFSKQTGVPLQGARVSLRLPVILSQELRTFTDGNGFFTFEVSTELEILFISAVCRTAEGEAISGRARSIRLREGTIRRDLYIDVGPRRSFSQCRIEFNPFGDASR